METKPCDFEYLGQTIMSRYATTSSVTSNRRFRSMFGTSTIVVSKIWSMLAHLHDEAGVCPAHLLWALMFIKLYIPETALCAMAGKVYEKTYRKWCSYLLQI